MALSSPFSQPIPSRAPGEVHILRLGQLPRVDGVDDGPGVREAHAVPGAVGAAGPPGVDEPGVHVVLGHPDSTRAAPLFGVWQWGRKGSSQH